MDNRLISYSWSERFPESTNGDVWFVFCSISCWAPFRNSSLFSTWNAFVKLKMFVTKYGTRSAIDRLIWISNKCKTDRIFYHFKNIKSILYLDGIKWLTRGRPWYIIVCGTGERKNAGLKYQFSFGVRMPVFRNVRLYRYLLQSAELLKCWKHCKCGSICLIYWVGCSGTEWIVTSIV